jgi:hypothetical protein
MIQAIKRWLERILEVISISLLISMAVIVVVAVVFRFLGKSLIWYDEVASVNLAWLTYYGSALAVIHRGHLGFPGLFLNLPKPLRAAAFITAESVVIGFFAIIGYAPNLDKADFRVFFRRCQQGIAVLKTVANYHIKTLITIGTNQIQLVGLGYVFGVCYFCPILTQR